MLAEKNGLRSVWRSKGKTCLFLLLLLALTAVLALALCIYSAVDSYLDDCDRYYHTIANLEYIGTNYPDSNVYDEKLASIMDAGELKINELQSRAGVINYQPNRAALAVSEGAQPPKIAATKKDAAVLAVSRLKWDEGTGAYSGIINQCLYSYEDNADKLVFIDVLGQEELELSQTQTYLLTGTFTTGKNGYLWFRAEPDTLAIDGETVDIPACMPLDGELTQDNIYSQLAESMRIRNSGLRMQMIGQVEDDYAFNQEKISIVDGRTFSSEEVEGGARVCLMSQKTAETMGLHVGDTVDFSLYYSEGDGIYSAKQLCNGADFADTYQIVGLFSDNSDYNGYVFVPYSADYAPDSHPTGYTVGQFRLENGQDAAFNAAAKELLPEGFRLTVYDQGYEAAATPFNELLRIARIFLAVCMLVILAALCLFAYLFVYRQWEAAQTMYALGAGKWHIFRYFLAGSGSIVLLSAAVGATVGGLLEKATLQMVAGFVERYQTADLRYSASQISITKNLAFSPDTPFWVYLLAAVLMVLLTLAACALFTQLALHKQPKKKKRKVRAPKRMAKSSHLSGRWKYAVLSVRRGGLRTAAVLLLSAIVAMFLGQLASTANVYREQLADFSANTKIRAYVTDVGGLNMDNLIVYSDTLESLYQTGLVSDIGVTESEWHYRFEGVRCDAQGNAHEVAPTKLPTGQFAFETFQYQMSLEPKLVPTNSLYDAPEFYYSSPEATWLEGYDESCLRGDELNICVLPESFMQREGVELGSVVRFYCMSAGGLYGYMGPMDLYVVGSYPSKSGSETVYVPTLFETNLNETSQTTPARPLFPGEFSPKGMRYEDVTAQKIELLSTQLWENLTQDGLICFSCPGQTQEELQSAFWASETNVCVMHWEQKAAYNLEFGDTLTIVNDAGQSVESTLIGAYGRVQVTQDGVTLKEMGSFTDEIPDNQPPEGCQYEYDSGARDIFCAGMSNCYTRGERGIADGVAVCKSAIFTLNDATKLDTLRQTLEDLDCRAVGQQRGADLRAPIVVLDDWNYVTVTDSLQRQITYLDILYDCLYVCVGILGLVVSYLLVTMRKKEIGIMRSLGTQRMQIFGGFFAEQLLLVLVGCAAGLGIWWLTGHVCNGLCLILTGAFALCWMVGTAVSVLHLLRSKALDVLSDRE